jgi:membrane protein DedA with SNARE-associated domain
VVFFGRFIAVLRTLAALLAGINQMAWLPFFGANLAGAILWAGGFGAAAALLGHEIHKVSSAAGLTAIGLAALALVGSGELIRRNQQRLEAKAEAEFPGPLGVGGSSRS